MSQDTADIHPDDDILYCTVHPTFATSLRCNKCGRPMCTKCAVRTPVGYRCRECVRGQQAVFYSANTRDYVIAAGVAFVLALVAGFIVPGLGPFFAIILGPVVGGGIAQAVRWATGRRRGEHTGYVVAAAVIVGSLPGLWPTLQYLFLGVPLGSMLLQLASPLLFAVLAAVVAFGWFRYGPRV
ncbi:MAG: hypothetical protein JW910_16265 [Anaerolineae bacterium]|nr:hypothetical protein [Anaerolineae bacterium]